MCEKCPAENPALTIWLQLLCAVQCLLWKPEKCMFSGFYKRKKNNKLVGWLNVLFNSKIKHKMLWVSFYISYLCCAGRIVHVDFQLTFLWFCGGDRVTAATCLHSPLSWFTVRCCQLCEWNCSIFSMWHLFARQSGWSGRSRSRNLTLFDTAQRAGTAASHSEESAWNLPSSVIVGGVVMVFFQPQQDVAMTLD